MNQGKNPQASAYSSYYKDDNRNEISNYHPQSESQKYHTSSEERMIAFQKFIRRYES
jgi:hypothetical protein